MKTRNIFLAATLGIMTSAITFSQNVAINTSGSSAATTNMFEVTQSSTTNNTVGIFAKHNGAATNAYAIWAEAIGATNKYAIVVPGGSGNVGIGTTTPSSSAAFNIETANYRLLGLFGSSSVITATDGVTQAGVVVSPQFSPSASTIDVVGIDPYMNLAPGGGITISNAYGLRVRGVKSGAGTVTNGFGLYVDMNPGFGTNKYAGVFLNGNVGVGTASPVARLDVVYPGTTATYASKILHSGNASNPGTGLAVSNGYPASSASGSYEIFGVYGNSFGNNYVSVRDNGNAGIGTTTPGTVPDWAQLSNMRVLEVSGDGSAGTFTDGLLMLSNNRATATVGDQVGALCFAHKSNAGSFPAVICSYLTGAGGANGFGAKLEFHTKANNLPGHLLRMVINQDGYLGIGTASPSAHVDIYDALAGVTTLNSIKDFTGIGNVSAAFIGGVDFGKTNTGIYVLQKDNIGFSSATTYLFNVVENGSSKMVVTGQGNVGIGTVPGEIFTVHVAANQNVGLQSIGGIPTILAHNDAWGAWQDIGLGNNVLVAKSTGLVGIGTTNPAYTLDVAGSFNATTLYCNTALWCSDVRFKKEITALNEPLENILKLRGVNYYWKTKEFPEKLFSETKQIGFIAQEIENIFPELVSTNMDGYKSVDYSHLTPILVEAMKEQQKMIEDLKAEKSISDSRIERLEALVGSLVQTSQK